MKIGNQNNDDKTRSNRRPKARLPKLPTKPAKALKAKKPAKSTVKKNKRKNSKNKPDETIKIGSGKRLSKKDIAKEARGKKGIVRVPTNHRENLVDNDVMRPHNFLSATTATLTKIFRMRKSGQAPNQYKVDPTPHHVSAILKLILVTNSTNDMGFDWSVALWNITQQDDILPDDATVTFTRSLERRDNEFFKKKAKRRRRLSILSSDSEDNMKTKSQSVNHDLALINAVDSGDSVVGFSAEAIISAPNEQRLEVAMDAVRNYFRTNDETRGLRYELDVNKQNKPLILFGPNDPAGNKDIYNDISSWEAGITGLFVDSGGDRVLGAEYVGVSVGKLIRSHAAYNFINHASLFIGNDTLNQTTTMGFRTNAKGQNVPLEPIDIPTQVYLSEVSSRAYMLQGKRVTHFIIDRPETADDLMNFNIDESRKVRADVSKGLLNIMEAVDNGDLKNHPDRILSTFPAHLNNIIMLLNQFRDEKLSINDDFANVTRDILIDFFVTNKYWEYDARNNLENLRLVNVRHQDFKQLSDFGAYIAEQRTSNTDPEKQSVLNDLNTIVNTNILGTIPSLNTKTSPLIDKLVRAEYQVIDFTGMSATSVGTATNPSLNTMLISYLNLILPSMQNGDVLMFHGISRVSDLARVLKKMIAQSGINLDLVFTESNQEAGLSCMSATSDVVEEENDQHELVTKTRAMRFDLTMVDLYKNRTDKLEIPLGMNHDWVDKLQHSPESYFVKTETGLDYIFLDRIL